MRATRAVIHLDHLVHNLNEIRKLAGPDVRLCLPVKAAAYGHGAVPVAKCALENGVSVLAVATVDEGMELRAAGISAPVLLFSVPDDAELEALVRARLTPFVSEPRLVLQLEKAAAAVLSGGERLAVHLKVETGMGRTGCAPDSAGVLAEETIRDSISLMSDDPDEFLENLGIEGGLSGLDFSDSEWISNGDEEKANIKIVVKYSMKNVLFPDFDFAKTYKFCQSASTLIW